MDCFAQPWRTPSAPSEIRIIEIQGVVEFLPKGGTTWSAAWTNQVLRPLDHVRAASNSRLAVHWSDESIVSVGASTELEILAPSAADDQAGLQLLRGVISFFHRDKPGHIHVITRGAAAGVEGTEFVMAVNSADATTLSVVDGRVRFGNAQAALVLTNGEQAVTEMGKAPVRTAGFIANNILQWCFYYPAVLDPDELQLTASEQQELTGSLAAYRSGDLLAALAKYPAGRQNISDQEKVFYAGLLLSVGEVAEAEAALSSVSNQTSRPGKLGLALRQLMAAVKRQPPVTSVKPQLASEFLANSYFEQSLAVRETSLQNALQLAKRATAISPNFGFAWERVAELEFSFGQTKEALKALDTSLALAPRNAQALALKGFVLAAQNQPRTAREWFDRAIATDAALGNAWLGRGLVRIHLGDSAGGREDLLVAAALEPQRAELRSYLGKAYAHKRDDIRASKELDLAKKLDPNDPTAWLYSALLNQQGNRINDAIRDLEKSQSLNDNRRVYRSQLLLDQDSAARSANLAGVYRDAGMFDVSVREGARAVSSDYANYSAHLFLANSYEQLRDPNWSNLRYEAPATREFWIANLLAPTSAGWLSAIASEQPYSKLFDQNRIGVVSDTTYLERGAWTQLGAQFGTFDNFSYNFEAKYISDPGQRPNNRVDHKDYSLALKFQLAPQDSVFFNVEQNKISSGDLNEYYKAPAKPLKVSFTEEQKPNVFAGYHHEWSPGVHTLIFASSGTAEDDLLAGQAAHWDAGLYNGKYTNVRLLTDHNLVIISSKTYSAELQQIWETPKHTTIAGVSYAWGDLRFQNREWMPSSGIGGEFLGRLGKLNPEPKYFPSEITRQDAIVGFNHLSLYGYHDWQIIDWLKLFAGVSYDTLRQPAVVDNAPFSREEKTTTQTSPKIGLIWTPLRNTTFRAGFTRSLSGFLNDSSVRLEPTEVAGFNQAYRSIIPNTIVGDTSGSKLSSYDVSLEQKFDTGTYLTVSGEILDSSLVKYEGAYYFDGSDNSPMQFPDPRGLRRSLDFREQTFTASIDQLLGEQWSAGTRYQLSKATLESSYLDISPKLPKANIDPPFRARQSFESVLQTVNLHANWNHPSGLFSIFEANWYHQNNWGFAPTEPGDDFWQYNVKAGCRFWHRKAELSIGVLNIADQDYRLEPLNLYNEMARNRTFFARLLLSF